MKTSIPEDMPRLTDSSLVLLVADGGIENSVQPSVDKQTQAMLNPAASETTDSQEQDLILSFFVVGAIINIAMILAYIVWALRQWRKR